MKRLLLFLPLFFLLMAPAYGEDLKALPRYHLLDILGNKLIQLSRQYPPPEDQLQIIKAEKRWEFFHFDFEEDFFSLLLSLKNLEGAYVKTNTWSGAARKGTIQFAGSGKQVATFLVDLQREKKGWKYLEHIVVRNSPASDTL